MDEALKNFINPDNLLDYATKQAATSIQAVALAIGGIFALIAMGYYYIAGIIQKDAFPIAKLLRILTLLFAIGAYKTMMFFPCELICIINKSTYALSTPMRGEQFKQFLVENSIDKTIYLEGIDPQEEQKIKTPGQQGSWTSIKNGICKGIASIFNIDLKFSLWGTILMLIKGVIKLIIAVVVKMLYILGPLAFLFSILPVFEQAIARWFNTFVSAFLSISTLNVLDCTISILNLSVDSNTNPFTLIALNIAFSVFYLLSFWLTSCFVGGGGDPGKVMSRAMEASQYVAAAYSKYATPVVRRSINTFRRKKNNP